MQEPPKPKPAPQPVPQLSRAPARPQLPVTEPAQELKTADASEGALSKRAAGNRSKGAPRAVASMPAVEPKPSAPDNVQDARPAIDVSEPPAIIQDSAEAVRVSGNRSKGAPKAVASMPAVEPKPSAPYTVQDARPAINASEPPAISQDSAEAVRESGNRSKGAPKAVASMPAAEPKPSAPDVVQDAIPAIDASEPPAISQDSAEAVRESIKPKPAAPVVPETIPEALPAPRRPTRPRSRAQPIKGAAPSISMQEDAPISTKDDASSAVAAEQTERATTAVSTEEIPANARTEATSSVAELEDPSQADILRAAGDTASASDVREGPTADVSTSTKAQDNGAGVELQVAPAPPVALPKPSLRAPQPAKAFVVRAFLSPRLLCMLARSVSCRCASTTVRMLPVHTLLTA